MLTTNEDGIVYSIDPSKSIAHVVGWKSGNTPKLRGRLISQGIKAETESIAESAFAVSPITSLTIPVSIKRVLGRACCGCKSLTSFTFDGRGALLSEIGAFAFAGTSITEFNFDSKVSTIGDSAFRECGNLWRITFSPQVPLSISASAFRSSALRQLALPHSLVALGRFAFADCPRLEAVVFDPGTRIERLEDRLFAGSSVSSLKLPEELRSIDGGALEGVCGVTGLESSDDIRIDGDFLVAEERLVRCLIARRRVALPEFVSEIGASSFSRIPFVFDIVIGDALRLIGARAFVGSRVRQLNLPASLVSIGDGAFAQCPELESLSVPENASLKLIGAFAFSESALSSIVFGSESVLTGIGAFAFSGTPIAEFTLPRSVTTLGTGAFSSTASLSEFEFAVGSAIAEIAPSAFAQTAVQKLDLPPTVVAIGARAFCEARFLSELTVPPHLREIGASAFAGTSLRSLSLPASLESIADSAFSRCRFLQSVSFADGSSLRVVGPRAFAPSRVRSVALPPSIAVLDGSAFGALDGPPELTLADSVVTKARGRDPLSVPASVTAIGPFAFSCFPAAVTFARDGSLKLIGASAFEKSSLTAVVLPASVVVVGASAFRGSRRLSAVEIPESSQLERIEPFAFADTDLATLALPATLASFSGSAVDQLSSIKAAGRAFVVRGSLLLSDDGAVLVKAFGAAPAIAVPDDVRRIAAYAFAGLRTLTTVALPGGLENIDGAAFAGTAVRVLELPPNVRVDPSAFEGVQAVLWSPANYVLTESLLLAPERDVLVRGIVAARSVVVPASVRRIGPAAFAGVEKIRVVECEIGSVLEEIDGEAFARSGLLAIRIPPGVVKIAAGAIPLTAKVELEAGLATPALEEAFETWTAQRKAGEDAQFGG
jgi:hypothetical protein